MHYSYRLYLNASGKRVLGKGGAQILEAIDEYGSIVGASRKLRMSYKFVWDYLTRMRKRLKEPIILTHRGGTGRGKKKGGGGTTLTPLAKTLLKEYRSTEALVNHALRSKKISVTLRRHIVTSRPKANLKRKT